MKCPCENCICIPICKTRIISDMAMNCSLLMDFLYHNPPGGKIAPRDRYAERIKSIEKAVSPVSHCLRIRGY